MMRLLSSAISMAANSLNSVIPTRITVTTTAAFMTTGFILGGLPGGMGGMVVGASLSPLINNAVDAVRVGAGKLVAGIKSYVSSAARQVEEVIYLKLQSLCNWSIELISASEEIFKTAQNNYLQALAAKGQSIQSLYIPIPDGVATQKSIIDTLVELTGFSAQELTERIALGHRVTQVLTSDEGKTKWGSGNSLESNKIYACVPTSAGSGEVLVENSRDTLRAITWYLAAQALWHASLKMAQEKHPNPLTGADLHGLANDILNEGTTFVFLDPKQNFFKFFQRSPVAINDETNVLNEQSVLPNNAKLPTIDDPGNRSLPGQAGRIAVNTLRMEQPMAALQLQPKSNADFSGIAPEGHEGPEWQILQRKLGFVNVIKNAVDAVFKPASKDKPLTAKERRINEVHKAFIEVLKKSYPNNEQILADGREYLQKISLIQLLESFTSDESAKKAFSFEQDELNKLLYRINDIGLFNQLKSKVADAVLANTLSLRVARLLKAREIFVPILSTKAELQAYILDTNEEVQNALKQYKDRLSTVNQVKEMVENVGRRVIKSLAIPFQFFRNKKHANTSIPTITDPKRPNGTGEKLAYDDMGALVGKDGEEDDGEIFYLTEGTHLFGQIGSKNKL